MMRIKPKAVQAMIDALKDTHSGQHLTPHDNATVTLKAGDWELILATLEQHRDEAPNDVTVCPACGSESIENGHSHDVTCNTEIISFGSCWDCGTNWTNRLHIYEIDID